MTNKLLGTGIIAGFPTTNGNIYPKDVLEKAINDQYFRRRVVAGEVVGGVLNPRTKDIVGNIITHKVMDVRFFNEELVVEIEVLDNTDAQTMFSSINDPEAVLMINCPEVIFTGATIRQIDSIRTIHIRERKK